MFNLKSKFIPFWAFPHDKLPSIQDRISKFGGKMHVSTVKIPINFSTTWVNTQPLDWYPASIATLAQRWPNVNSYVGPTSAHQRWANVDLSIGPTLAQRSRANVGPTLCQHRPNVGALTLGQRWANVTPMVVCQRCTNIGPTEAALLAFCEGNPSITDGFPHEGPGTLALMSA